MHKYSLILFTLIMLSGCQGPQSPSNAETALSEEAARYIALFDQELRSMDNLNSKAVSNLLSDSVAPKHQQQTATAVSEKIQQAKRQILASVELLEEKKIPVQMPKAVREDLLAARDDLLRAYRIKLKSLDLLNEYRKKQQSHLLEQYRRLTAESANVMQEARSYLNNAKKRAESK